MGLVHSLGGKEARRALPEVRERDGLVDIIEAAIPDAREEIRMGNLDSLTHHQRVVLELVDSHRKIGPGDLYEKYRNRVEEPKFDRTIRNYLAKLEQ